MYKWINDNEAISYEDNEQYNELLDIICNVN